MKATPPFHWVSALNLSEAFCPQLRSRCCCHREGSRRRRLACHSLTAAQKVPVNSLDPWPSVTIEVKTWPAFGCKGPACVYPTPSQQGSWLSDGLESPTLSPEDSLVTWPQAALLETSVEKQSASVADYGPVFLLHPLAFNFRDIRFRF